ncbi:hypothetical protein CY34DRAFT_810073 [Suillus luteus UH-Slu-Lm8-n1]|uniref:Uncharacterized protein n=1 Tax=Suillus luteus UH-Slu-Lm8-n1 TaxID=930992 RepID=A0A0D0A7W4_9AGAM|nr:hypothetical protein CY34DRAFT_810073 [Suillus luteus UH-Slu-Lm8-n1]
MLSHQRNALKCLTNSPSCSKDSTIRQWDATTGLLGLSKGTLSGFLGTLQRFYKGTERLEIRTVVRMAHVSGRI